MSKINKEITINVYFYGVPKNICKIYDSLCCLTIDQQYLHPLTTLNNIHDKTAYGVYGFCVNVLKILNLEGISCPSIKTENIVAFKNGLLYECDCDKYIRLDKEGLLQAYYLTIVKLKEYAQSCIDDGIVFQYDNMSMSDQGLELQEEFDKKIMQEKRGILYEQNKFIHSLIKRNRIRDRNRKRRSKSK